MRIRIAVAVAKDGEWKAHGSGALDDRTCERWLHDWYQREPHHVVFVEADVPLPPEPITVEGTVVE